MSPRLVSIIASATLALAACPGDHEFKIPPDSGVPHYDVGGSDITGTLYDAPPASDSAPTVDTGPAKDSQPQPDTQEPQPDVGVPGVGQPCPPTCKAGLYCVANVCRAACNKPTDGCKSSSNCSADHRCVEVKGSTTVWACIPATQPGAACDLNTYCPNNHVCGQVGSGPWQCLPTCPGPAGSACGTGGQCLQAGACLFCTKL